MSYLPCCRVPISPTQHLQENTAREKQIEEAEMDRNKEAKRANRVKNGTSQEEHNGANGDHVSDKHGNVMDVQEDAKVDPGLNASLEEHGVGGIAYDRPLLGEAAQHRPYDRPLDRPSHGPTGHNRPSHGPTGHNRPSHGASPGHNRPSHWASAHNRPMDPLAIPQGPMTRARAKRFKEALLGFVRSDLGDQMQRLDNMDTKFDALADDVQQVKDGQNQQAQPPQQRANAAHNNERIQLPPPRQVARLDPMEGLRQQELGGQAHNENMRPRRGVEREEPKDNIKYKIPKFNGRGSPSDYLEWESKLDMYFDYHPHAKPKKSFMRKRFVPSFYTNGLYEELQSLRQGTRSVDEYYSEMMLLMSKTEVDEAPQATIARFLAGLNREIHDIVEMQQHYDVEKLLQHALKAESQVKRNKKSFASSSSSWKTPIKKDEKSSRSWRKRKRNRDEELALGSSGDGGDERGLAYDDEDDDDGSTPALVNLVARRTLSAYVKGDVHNQRENLFHTMMYANGKPSSVIIDGGSCTNIASMYLVKELALPTTKHPKPYSLGWFNDREEIKVNKQVLVSLSLGRYDDKVLCDVLPMQACHVLLGRPWQYDNKVHHDGETNKYSFMCGKRLITRDLGNFEDLQCC
ncbi:Retrotransposon gag protein [Corchorus capsularis]|uniref:Retrotransposon gag protein n=1 Tax=Corchorus capsularis TaxID=210143 RepID=A0A1R3J778_COCAP|nr:Retrotransposon gag protein [Corchorus capsularis]